MVKEEEVAWVEAVVVEVAKEYEWSGVYLILFL